METIQLQFKDYVDGEGASITPQTWPCGLCITQTATLHNVEFSVALGMNGRNSKGENRKNPTERRVFVVLEVVKANIQSGYISCSVTINRTIIEKSFRYSAAKPWIHQFAKPSTESQFSIVETGAGINVVVGIEVFAALEAPRVQETRFSAEIGSILDDEASADVKIYCTDGVSIRAHSNILCARSAVMKNCLRGEMAASSLSPRCDSETARKFLKYVYSNSLETSETPESSTDIPAKLCKLLSVASYFIMPALSAACVERIKQTVNEDNVVSLLLELESFGNDDLDAFAIQYFVRNSRAVHKTQGYRELIHKAPNLYQRITDAVINC